MTSRHAGRLRRLLAGIGRAFLDRIFVMNEGKTCPNCKGEIDAITILKSGFSSGIQCPGCKARLKYSPFPLGLVSTFLVIYVCLCVFVLIFANSYEVNEQGWKWGLDASVLLIIPIGLILELITVWYLRNRCTLVENHE